ncbi:hypothetical protein BDK51DRAFT_29310 [Blyttiomyces helicus]|uniref:Uncharacterized protein n=1 Tax=Blyttiomyces helicus TaxID=388810 RepID=A0A4P9WD14_9FUNG|nr:hypothetical protein BDK51DRAFT_29310 [Blyttiomyces helicus]|eukprot:RKO89523.1 hypothetical protein BDK51DRAFT_29310 [Blyttiomyces helicus]
MWQLLKIRERRRLWVHSMRPHLANMLSWGREWNVVIGSIWFPASNLHPHPQSLRTLSPWNAPSTAPSNTPPTLFQTREPLATSSPPCPPAPTPLAVATRCCNPAEDRGYWDDVGADDDGVTSERHNTAEDVSNWGSVAADQDIPSDWDMRDHIVWSDGDDDEALLACLETFERSGETANVHRAASPDESLYPAVGASPEKSPQYRRLAKACNQRLRKGVIKVKTEHSTQTWLKWSDNRADILEAGIHAGTIPLNGELSIPELDDLLIDFIGEVQREDRGRNLCASSLKTGFAALHNHFTKVLEAFGKVIILHSDHGFEGSREALMSQMAELQEPSKGGQHRAGILTTDEMKSLFTSPLADTMFPMGLIRRVYLHFEVFCLPRGGEAKDTVMTKCPSLFLTINNVNGVKAGRWLKDSPMVKTPIQNSLKELCVRIDFIGRNIRPHSLRAVAITTLLKAGVHAEVIRRAAGTCYLSF